MCVCVYVCICGCVRVCMLATFCIVHPLLAWFMKMSKCLRHFHEKFWWLIHGHQIFKPFFWYEQPRINTSKVQKT